MNNYYDRSGHWAEQNSNLLRPLATNIDVNAFLRKVFSIMAIGVALTGLVSMLFAAYLAKNPDALAFVFGTGFRWVIMLSPLAFVLVLSFGINKMSASVATLVFGLFAAVMGISLSSIFFLYTAGSIAATFFITAGMFAALAFLGYTTKMDLTKLGSILLMALIGLIIASLVNIFMQSSILYWVISFAGVVIFSGLTAYDVQKLKEMAQTESVTEGGEVAGKLAILGALTLYLDFINLFLYLLRFFGSRDE